MSDDDFAGDGDGGGGDKMPWVMWPLYFAFLWVDIFN